MLGTLRTGAPGCRDYLIQAGDDSHAWWWRGVWSRDYV